MLAILVLGKAARQALVPVLIVSEPAGGVGHLEVQWPGGIVLRVQGCDMQTVGAVVAALCLSSPLRVRRKLPITQRRRCSTATPC